MTSRPREYFGRPIVKDARTGANIIEGGSDDPFETMVINSMGHIGHTKSQKGRQDETKAIATKANDLAHAKASRTEYQNIGTFTGVAALLTGYISVPNLIDQYLAGDTKNIEAFLDTLQNTREAPVVGMTIFMTAISVLCLVRHRDFSEKIKTLRQEVENILS